METFRGFFHAPTYRITARHSPSGHAQFAVQAEPSPLLWLITAAFSDTVTSPCNSLKDRMAVGAVNFLKACMAGIKGKSGGKRAGAGRAAFKPTGEQRELVEQLSSFGHRQSEIVLFVKGADGKSISEPTLLKNFKAELTDGKVKANVKIAQTLYKKAAAGDTTSIIFWLKSQAGWKDTQRVELTGAGGGPIEQKTTVTNESQIKAAVKKLESEY